ncbi:MAG: MiaB/RimO family radical SAM methylthiotransferase [Planctomycetes bacterium]|nr:MiaB/RimO family radical SAM methylthiotransferase [Planctomycetota bacterium]
MPATTVYLETFGCQMNELDSELVRGQLGSLGYTFADRPEDAQIVLLNTCSVREHAESKAYSRIGIVGQRKLAGENILLGVLGCMAERDGLALLRRFPQVDIMCGPGELDKLPTLIDASRRSEAASAAERTALAGNRTRRSAALAAVQDDLENLDLSRAFDPIVAGRSAFAAQVRITRGCNKFCTYCVVPNTRGAEVHRPPDSIVEECRKLADAGAIEITLLGQTVNHYRYEHGPAVTLDGREAPQIGPGLSAFRAPIAAGKRVTTFAQLLRRIHDEVPAIARLRFVTSYPRDFGRDILETMRDCPRICRYLHAPAQSGSDRILKLMNRGYTRGEYEAFATEALEILPDATLAGDFIVGFPTESDEDFEASCDLVRKLPFKNNFIFKYSPRPGTVAIDRFKDDIPNEVKKLRNSILLNLQAETSSRVHAAWIGKTVEVLIEEVCTLRDAHPTARGVELRWETKEPRDHRTTLRGRTAGDLIVSLDTPDGAEAGNFVGNIVTAQLMTSSSLMLHGVMVAGNGPSPRVIERPTMSVR